jgi:hypothetical protein
VFIDASWRCAVIPKEQEKCHDAGTRTRAGAALMTEVGNGCAMTVAAVTTDARSALRGGR